MNLKIHLHHSHVAREIYRYAHNFCNWKVRENQLDFSCLVNNFFGFDSHFLIKGIILSVWETKDLNIGDSNLSSINFANIGTLVKHRYFEVLPKKFNTIDKYSYQQQIKAI